MTKAEPHQPAVGRKTSSPPGASTRRRGVGLLLPVGAVAIVLLAIASLFVGSGYLRTDTVAQILIDGITGELPPEGQRSTEEIVVWQRRVPRALLAILVGAALAVAGALMQALTRNPLADPGLLGVNAGSYFAVVMTSALTGTGICTAHMWMAILGALLSTVVVYLIGLSGGGGRSPSQMVLAGVAWAAVLSGVTLAITLSMPEVFDSVRFWAAGSLQGRSFDEIAVSTPFILLGVALSMLLIRALNVMALGDHMATSLGGSPRRIRVLGLAMIVVLCGSATAVAGPLTFIGLMVPHALRLVVGPDYRWLMPMCVLAGPLLVLGADILARVVVAAELPVGVVTAFIGAPVLIMLVRRQRVGRL